MIFDASTARALSRRTHNVQECLVLMKKAVVQAAQAGEFEVSVGLADPMLVAPGQSTNNASFLIDHFERHGLAAWRDAVTHAVQAGYNVRPAWRTTGAGAAPEGITLSWYLVEPPDVSASALMLMDAQTAHAMSKAEQVHQRWVEGHRETIRKAALGGLQSVTVHDDAATADPAWPKRCDILQRAGFSTELIASDSGTVLVIGW